MTACHSLDITVLRDIHRQLTPFTNCTPLIRCDSLSQMTGGQVWIKAESLQKTAAFKFRGALYRLMQLQPDEKAHGVVAYSSGNFASGLAAAGQLLGVNVSLVMPADAPATKIDNATRYGGEVQLCHSSFPSREEAAAAMAESIAVEQQRVLLHPFDDPILITGQATVTLELLEQLEQQGITCDALLCPTGGGSLVAGAVLAVNALQSTARIYSVEPLGYEGMALSLQQNKITSAQVDHTSHCDALQARRPGGHNFQIVQKSDLDTLVVDEFWINKAVQHAALSTKLIVEPSGAAGIAALMQYPQFFSSKNTVVIASGGNVDLERYIKYLNTSTSELHSGTVREQTVE